MFRERTFKYTGAPALTRGDYGVNVAGGHNTANDPESILVFDPDCGDSCWISIEAGLECGDGLETTPPPTPPEVYEYGHEEKTEEQFIREFIGLDDYVIVGLTDYPLPGRRETIRVWLVQDSYGAFLGALQLTVSENRYLGLRWLK